MKRVYSTSAQLYLLACAFIFLTINSCTINNESEIVLSSDFPDYKINYSGDIDYIQAQFDKEMWKTFVALTWPADNLEPVAKGNIIDNHDVRSVFENYSFNYDLFLLNVNDTTKFLPVDWGDSNALNIQRQARWALWSQHSELCPDLVADAKSKGITNMAEIIPLDEFIQASNDKKPHVPQIDKDTNFVWSAVVFNEVTYDFVVNNKLFSSEGIDTAKQHVQEEVVHHIGSENQDTFLIQMVNSLEDKVGAMHLKTSWKIMGDGDDTTKFHKAWAALLFNNLNFEDGKKWMPQCSLVRVGLVGMHIAVKTKDQPGFIWTTFEHNNNCPEIGKIKHNNYTFYDSLSPTTINKAPFANDTLEGASDPFWFNPKKSKHNIPSQIVREIPIPDETKALNKTYQDALANTVWANYQLVGTQWTDPNTQKTYPRFLSNTTLETFDQSGSSCFGCHHQVTANTLKGGPNNDQFSMAPFPIDNVLNVDISFGSKLPMDSIKPAIYSDYMWSLLKWSEIGHLTWKQTKPKKK